MRLVCSRVDIDVAVVDAVGAGEVCGFLDTDTSLRITPEGLTATLQLRCRVATPDRARVAVDVTLWHELAYRFTGSVQDGERIARGNALFAVWPYWRAMLADVMAHANLRMVPLPLLAAGIDKLTSHFEVAQPD